MESKALRIGTVSGSLLLAIAATIAVSVLAYALRSTGEGPRSSSGSAPAASAAASNPVAAGEAAAFVREGTPPIQAIRATEVQDRLTSEQLTQKLVAALGPAYGGEWFDPATATLHVGVTSAANRRAVEAVAARAGLAANVAAMPVSSSWAELAAAQKRWDGRLAGLFARNEVATSLDPQRNSVAVRLGSGVPVARRAALEREVAGAAVGVDITSVAGPKLEVRPDLGRCAKFVSGMAYCNPTIVGGQRIEVAKGESCTAGPTALRRDLSQETTETFLLTAGHCIEKSGGKGKTWEARDKKTGKPTAIGAAVAATATKADIGAIKVETTNGWAEANNPPVEPAIAAWKTTEETEPFGVPGEVATGVGKATCYSGQISGMKCGTVAFLGEKIGKLEDAVEVKGMTAQEGDSGAPFYSAEESSRDWVEGILAGEEETSHNIVYSPIRWALEQLSSQIELELLTESNEVRPNEPMK